MNMNKNEFETKLKNFKLYLQAYENISSNTIESYLTSLKQYKKYLLANELNFLTIQNTDAEKYILFLSSKGIKRSTLNSKIFALRKFYNYLFLIGEVCEKHFNLIKTKTVKQTQKSKNYITFDDAEFEKVKQIILLSSSPKLKLRNLLLIEILFYTGIRVSELINIKLSDINSNLDTICVFGKGSKQNIIYLNSPIQKTLLEYLTFNNLNLNASQFLFTNQFNKKLTRQAINRIVKKQLANHYPNISPHSLRYSFASNLFYRTDNILITQSMLNHSSTETTQIYLNFDLDLLAKKVAKINEQLVGEFECLI